MVPPSQTPFSVESRPNTILVVEDEMLVRLAISDYLRECGFRVQEAANAEEAIQILCGSDEPIDLVFSDIEMPGELDGFGLARWVHANKPQVRVLLTSGHAHSAELAADLCESTMLLPKPYQYSSVLDTIKQFVARPPARP